VLVCFNKVYLVHSKVHTTNATANFPFRTNAGQKVVIIEL